ncbi:MAG: hypothetical protein QOJ13_1183 [Gaiellales bacterium]|nr:hypothetical protein [Gaiellales bacterium]
MAIAALVAAMAAAAPTADATPRAFLTIQIGRSQLGMAGPGCTLLPGSVGLADIAGKMHALGHSGTGAVVVGHVAPSRYRCHGMIRYPGWKTLDTLRQRYGWSFVSAGMRYADTRRMSRAEQVKNICGSLDVMRAHGHKGAWGMFAYPGDRSNTQVQRDVTSKCFAYGRTYHHGLNRPSGLKSPWFQKTYSVDGGACNVRSLPCYKIVTPVWPAHYLSPHVLAGLMAPGAGSWRVVQMYRFVKGKRSEGKVQWDCTGADWRTHWTTRIEVYCAGDFLDAVRSIPSRVSVVGPATVARAWGRVPR